MAKPQSPPPSLFLAAVFSRHDAALDWAEGRLAALWGRVQLRSLRFDHSETRYYEAEMGVGLKKQFLVFDGLFDPQQLPKRKLESNRLEEELASSGDFAELRPVNIDPGYLTLTKLVLASAKDRLIGCTWPMAFTPKNVSTTWAVPGKHGLGLTQTTSERISRDFLLKREI